MQFEISQTHHQSQQSAMEQAISANRSEQSDAQFFESIIEMVWRNKLLLVLNHNHSILRAIWGCDSVECDSIVLGAFNLYVQVSFTRLDCLLFHTR